MFSKHTTAQRKMRQEDRLFFSSMVVSVVAFYIILSFPNQDVMIFLKKMESDAVHKLFLMIPIFFVASLVILYFLVHFAMKMQLDQRRHEFGVYMMHGMRRKNLFLMLLWEDVKSNVKSLLLGLPIAILLSEFISLLTAKVVGLGIIGHRFSISWMAIIFTTIGFLAVKLVASVYLSAQIIRQEIGDLLGNRSSKEKPPLKKMSSGMALLLGTILLLGAYYLGWTGKAFQEVYLMAITVFLGILGTMIFFLGLRFVIEWMAKRGSNKRLHVYNFRQIQELIVAKTQLLAACSLLIFAGVSLFGAGLSIATSYANTSFHVVDYTFPLNGEERPIDKKDITNVLKKERVMQSFDKLFEIKMGNPSKEKFLSFDGLVSSIEALPTFEGQENLAGMFSGRQDCYLISLSGINQLLIEGKQKPLTLKNQEVILYQGPEFLEKKEELKKALEQRPELNILGQTYALQKELISMPLVADRSITISTALIVPDDKFEEWTEGNYNTFVNGVLKAKLVKEKGLMQAISGVNEELNRTSLVYESYLTSMGRQWFYMISSTYITIYLAVLFLVIANTIVGVQFLMGQQSSYHRYQTLIHLGATYPLLCQSSDRQIHWYFGLPIVVALVNSFFGIRALFTGFIPLDETFSMEKHLLIALAILGMLGVIEWIYISMVKKSSRHNLWGVMNPKRED